MGDLHGPSPHAVWGVYFVYGWRLLGTPIFAYQFGDLTWDWAWGRHFGSEPASGRLIGGAVRAERKESQLGSGLAGKMPAPRPDMHSTQNVRTRCTLTRHNGR